jgi:DNA-binding XRE family transcriptional regulator
MSRPRKPPKSQRRAAMKTSRAVSHGARRPRLGLVNTVADPVTLPRAEYETLLARIEDLEDTREIQAAEARGLTPDALPDALVARLLGGEHPVRIWREHRGLTLTALAERADVPQGYLSEIENGKKPGSVKTLKALATALNVDLDDLVP